MELESSDRSFRIKLVLSLDVGVWGKKVSELLRLLERVDSLHRCTVLMMDMVFPGKFFILVYYVSIHSINFNSFFFNR